MFCGNCGKEIKEDYLCCPYCGLGIKGGTRTQKQDACPHCGSSNVYGCTIQSSHDLIRPVLYGTGMWGSMMKAIVCLECGTVVRFFAENPDRLMKKEKQ